MHSKLIEMIDDELEMIKVEGLNCNNLSVLYKLVDIEKDIYTIMAMKNSLHSNDAEEHKLEEKITVAE